MSRDPQAQVNSKSGNVGCDNIRIREDMILSGAIRGHSESETIEFANTTNAKKDLTVDKDTSIKGNLIVTGGINENVAGTFDIIIVGLGTAGSVTFRRISDGDPTLSILGLVTGKNNNENPISKYPYAFSDPTLETANVNSVFTGAATDFTDTVLTYNWLNFNLNRNTTNIWAGRGQGGMMMNNFGFYIRPSPGFHNYTSNFAGPFAAQWDSTSCNSIYEELETYLGPPAQPNRGYSGPIRTTQNPVLPNVPYGDTLGDILNSFASQSLAPEDNALSITLDYNSNQELALAKSQQFHFYPDADSPIGISRSSSSEGYLGADFITQQGFSAVGRNNRIIYEAYVNRIVFDENNNAVGVDVIINGECKRYKANKKIIIQAGGMRSPGILERSGIGSGSILSGLGITQIVENPNVGENFKSHYSPAFLFTVDSDAYTLGGVPFTMKGYTSTSYPYDRNIVYSIEYPGGRSFYEIANSYGSNYNYYQLLNIPLNSVNVYFGYGQIAQPTSTGSVHITNKNIDIMPKWLWNLNSTDDSFVIRTVYQHVKRVEADINTNHPTMGFVLNFPSPTQYAGYPGAPTIVFTASITDTTLTVTAVASGVLDASMSILEGAVWSTTPAVSIIQGTIIVDQILPLLGGESIGGIGRYKINKSQTVGSMSMHGDFLEQAASIINIIGGHPCGTCRMGDRLTEQGVVDGQLHVYGVQNLMVADNSIWPQIPNCQTANAACLVGYQAADFCLATI